jgi:lipopolysaccharide transport protein LptA
MLLTGAPAAQAAEPDAAPIKIGVAPFEGVFPPGGEVPDLATLLADRLGTRGVGRIVGPAQLGADPDPEPQDAEVKGWAEGAQLETIVVGRTTRIGEQLSVDVHLRSGATGGVVGTYVAEIVRPGELEAAVDRLAVEVIEGTMGLRSGEGPPAVATAPSRAPEARAEKAPFGFGGGDAPLSIESEELEAYQKEGARRLLFRKNVRVKQGDLRLTSAALEAVYPADSSQPDRLTATGNVILVQGTRNARCDTAIYDRASAELTCRGSAVYREGDNRLSGDVIEIDLTTERVRVTGSAAVLIEPEDSGERAGP